MNRKLKHWRLKRRYHSTRRALRLLPPAQLSALGIPPSEIDRLSCEAARVPWK